MARLGDYITQVRGVSYKPEDVCDSSVKESIPIFRANNIQDDGLTFNDLVYVRTTRVSREQLIRAGDIVVCSSSGSRALVGKAAISKKDLQMSFGAFCKVIRTSKMNAEYLGYFFQSPIYRNRIAEVSGGANINNIRNEHINDIPFMVIDEETQSLAVEIFNKVTDLITLRKQQLAKLDEIVKSQFIEMFGDPVQNEKNWPMVRLADIAKIKIGPFGSLLHREDYVQDGHALVNPSHIIDGFIVADRTLTISEDKYRELSAYKLEIGDVVLGRRGEMGRCAVVYDDGLLCGTGSLIIRPGARIKPYFLQKIISHPTFKSVIEVKSVGVTMQNLNVPIVSNLLIPSLPLDLQEQFLNFVQQIDKSKFEIQKSLEKLVILKKALMQQYFG